MTVMLVVEPKDQSATSYGTGINSIMFEDVDYASGIRVIVETHDVEGNPITAATLLSYEEVLAICKWRSSL